MDKRNVMGGSGEILGSLLPLVVLFGIFYLLIIRPQQKQQKDHKSMIGALKKGDKIITSGGFIAEILKVEEEFFSIKLNDDTAVKLSKDFVSKKIDTTAESK